jgi:imidazole glycerol phosphate synthase subunit HisF
MLQFQELSQVDRTHEKMKARKAEGESVLASQEDHRSKKGVQLNLRRKQKESITPDVIESSGAIIRSDATSATKIGDVETSII